MKERRDALRRLSYGVYVISARQAETVNGLTMRMVSQVSQRPPRLALAMAKVRLTHQFIMESKAFVVNVLAEGQELIGGHFGLRTGRDMNKFAGIEYETGVTGAPILTDCSAFMECQLVASHDMGNCTLFIGEVVNAGTHDKTPLIYRESDYFG
jgi:flavin reductase (DIM6/NTAB) family NADH-FMN oxidoreductase RutF